MKCLVRLLGLYDVFHPSSFWKCAWCHTDKTNIADFTRTSWPLRDIIKMIQLGKKMDGKSDAQQKTHARTHHGLMCEPILAFVLEQIVPCFLHITMGITRALLKRLGDDADDNAGLAAELAQRLQSSPINLKLVDEQSKKSVKRSFSARLEKTRIQRPECLRIIEHQDYLLGALDAHDKNTSDVKLVCVLCNYTAYFEQLKTIWQQFWALLTLASQSETPVTEENWLAKAKIFANNYLKRYCAEDITPYIHVFVYHVGYYLEKYGNLEIFANYAIEGRHHYNKQVIASASNGFGRADGARNIQYQQLTRSLREDRVAGSRPQQRQKQTWASRSLARFPNMDSVFVAM